jgi:hypothetical protein
MSTYVSIFCTILKSAVLFKTTGRIYLNNNYIIKLPKAIHTVLN